MWLKRSSIPSLHVTLYIVFQEMKATVSFKYSLNSFSWKVFFFESFELYRYKF